MEKEITLSPEAKATRAISIQLADLYFEFVKEIRDAMGDEAAKKLITKVLFNRAKERAEGSIKRAEEAGLPRTWQNINVVTDVPLCGWVGELGRDHCPYGMAWNRRIEENPWFREYAALYCDVTDTTIGEVFTGDHTHALYENVVLGDEHCLRTYTPDENVQKGIYTYDPQRN
ncbi:MAG: hypothetical protein Q4C42_05840 [Clostridia bacterium]|nr:hypothetical protein [Clostridia bacterium]